MANDLDYFYEHKLNRSHITSFFSSLPDHLQQVLLKSLHTTGGRGRVLQGYRGPKHMCNGGSGDSEVLEASCGVQEIKFWWGITKAVNLIPLTGPIAFFILRALQKNGGELEWSSLYFDSKTGECLSHNKDEAAVKLNNKGCQLFQDGNYAEAAEYHSNALKLCSSGYHHEQTFKNNRDRALTENKAMQLNSEGDSLFKQGKYSEAFCKYQEACNKSEIVKEKNITILNKLCIIDTLWNKAWDAENDTENDRSDEAKDIFHQVLNESKIIPDNLNFKQYENLASLKIEGNILFNQGVESQRKGIVLMQEAQKLKHQQKLNSAYSKIKEARDQLYSAKEKFEKGSKNDERFLLCIEFVKEQCNEVLQSLEVIEQYTLSQRLNDMNVAITKANEDEPTIAVAAQRSFYEQI